MALRARTFPSTGATTDLGTTNTSPANTIVATSTLTRYIRSIHATNDTISALTWNFGIGAAAVLTATNSEFFGMALAPGATFDKYYGGKGKRVDNLTLMAFASAAGCKLSINYDESDATDA